MTQRAQPLQRKALQQLLVQVSEQGTPLRLDSETETYYVLTATQLQQLLQARLTDPPNDTDLPNDHSFTLEDFGLTEADVAAYEAAQTRQHSYLKSVQQRPLDPDLIRRLDALPRLQRLFPQRAVAEHEKLLRELETAMLDNLHAFIAKPE